MKLSHSHRLKAVSLKLPYSTSNPSLPPPPQALVHYVSLIRRCAAARSAGETRRVHLHMKLSGFPHLSLGNKLVDAYIKSGALDHAREVFDEMPHPHVVSWNAMISSYIRNRRYREALFLFKEKIMDGILPDEFTFSSVLRAFAALELVGGGRVAHGKLIVLGLDDMNVFVASALVDMYAKFGRTVEARVIYNRVDDKDVVLATALIVGYTQNGEEVEAIKLFFDMLNGGIRANEFTFASVLIAGGNLKYLHIGIPIHGIMLKYGLESRVSCQTSLVSMYSKCGLIDEGMRVFDEIENRNIVAWTAFIGCLVCNHREEAALSLFRSMIRDSIEPNAFTLSTSLRACSALALFEQGKTIHACANKIGLNKDRFVGTGLVDMYGKCGRVGMARMVFDGLGLDLVSMNSMINAYAQNGQGQEAVELFDMMQDSGLEPNDATLTSVLNACSNAGLLEEGRRVFSFVTNCYMFGPSNEHYACMVDLLGRAGRLQEAEGLITERKGTDKVLWRTLLSSCKLHGELEMAKRASRRVLELDPGDDGTYILLTNIYASLGQWDEVKHMKSTMRGMKLKKDPAMSWVEINREVHTFMAGDMSHPKAMQIYKELEWLIESSKELGYSPNTRYVLQELDELEKERSLYYHSEKLAIAFGVLSSKGKGKTCITIFKNLRVCGDCHAWIKLVSLVVGKEIIARDAKRFHHFKDGQCSCGDYW